MLRQFLNAKGDVYSLATTVAASGGAKRGKTLRAAGKRCRVQDASADQQANSIALNMPVTHMIYTSYSGTQNGDQWEVGGAVYRVVSVLKRRRFAGIGTFYTIAAQEVRA